MALRKDLGLQSLSLDSTGVVATQRIDTGIVKRNLKSPLVAVLFSAAVPGGGQIYNGSYWKVPIIIGAQTFFVSQWISNDKTYRSYRSQYSSSVISNPPYGNAGLMNLRDAYHDQRDSYAWYIAGVYLLSMLDAYVDAELSGFDVSPNLSSTSSGNSFGIDLRVRF